MMWNHRIVKTVNELGSEYFEIAEVFYDAEGKFYAYGNATIQGENLDELKEQVEWFEIAITKPILNYPEHFTGDVNK